VASLLSDENRYRFLTVRWNNILTVVLGLPMLLFAALSLSTSAFSDRAAFIGIAIFGAFY